MLTTDPPEHTRLRAVGARLINPSSVEALRADVEGDVDRVVARLGPVFEAYDDVGLPLATRVLARLLDVPDDELAQFGRLSQDASVNINPMSAGADGRRAAATLAFYLRSRLAVSEALRQWVDQAGWTEAEAAGVLSLCVIGGLEPLAVVVAAALVELTTSSGRAQAVRDGDVAVEDVLRLHTPIPFVARAVRTDLSLPSGTLSAGRRVLALIDSANRDAGVFADQATSASRHLSFGAGPHFCLGAPLVRMVMSSQLVRCAALPITAVDEPRSWAPSLIPRRLQPVHLRLV